MRRAHSGNGHGLRYVPYDALGDTPNIIVDGAPHEATVLTLSHWPGSGTPMAFKADTSTESCYRYLSAPEVGPQGAAAHAVSNNHVDVDGVLGIWALLNPKVAWEHLEEVVAAATADDFGRITSDHGAKVALALGRLAQDGGYEHVLPRVLDVLRDPDAFEPLYRDAWARITEDRALLESGAATVRELPAVDLAVVEAPRTLHPWAVNSATERMRVMEVVGGQPLGLRYRYETWVQFVSRPLMPRVDLAALVPALQAAEPAAGARWDFDGIADLTPHLVPRGPGGEPVPSTMAPDVFLAEVVAFLEAHQGDPRLTWNPYDP